MKKISIIIPLYNLEGLIGKCIASALDQDLPPEEYEVIVVDDGSTDGSLAAAQRAACGHANVQVHAKPNEGVSLARNYGTERAAGRYVMYVDADDYLSPGVLGGLTQIMDRERLDMLCFDMAGVDEHGGDLPLWSDGLFARGGGEVQSFTSAENTEVGAVQFALQTTAITAPAPAAQPEPAAVTLTFWQKLLKLFGLYKG